MVTAYVTLSARFQIESTGKAAISFRPVESSFFTNLDSELRELMRISARSTGTNYHIRDDNYGYRWIVLDDPQFEDLVSIVHTVGETIADHGFGPQLLAAVFSFREGSREVFWIYNYKRGKFYPFVPEGSQSRDTAAELRMRTAMERELPIERELEQWYGLWGIPF